MIFVCQPFDSHVLIFSWPKMRLWIIHLRNRWEPEKFQKTIVKFRQKLWTIHEKNWRIHKKKCRIHELGNCPKVPCNRYQLYTRYGYIYIRFAQILHIECVLIVSKFNYYNIFIFFSWLHPQTFSKFPNMFQKFK